MAFGQNVKLFILFSGSSTSFMLQPFIILSTYNGTNCLTLYMTKSSHGKCYLPMTYVYIGQIFYNLFLILLASTIATTVSKWGCANHSYLQLRAKLTATL
jgi:hypothetical protein